ncbi:MAG TPA: hypothetical protein VGF86_12265 [Candidatus Tumulicola sp.]|jgi:hypothetical protein
MFSPYTRFIGIALTVALAACAARADVPSSPAGAPRAAAVVSPNNWFHTWTFFVRNKTGERIRQFPHNENCMKTLPDLRYYEPDPERLNDQTVETSHEPECYLEHSRLEFAYYIERPASGYARVKWGKSLLDDYTIEVVDQQGLCASTQSKGVNQLVLNIRRC